MRPLTPEDLRTLTLSRQFPDLPGRDATSVLALVDLLGPIQSQVPRAPFLTASSRLPGVSYACVRDLFASFRLVKTTNLRGTVHTSVPRVFPWLDAVARRGRAGPIRNQLGLTRVSVEELLDEVEAFADSEWRSRAEILAHVREWLAVHESADSAAAVAGTFRESIVWGHSGLLRRPRDDRWEKRTDIYHRRARAVLPELGTAEPAESLPPLVRGYLRALGPATRHDLAHFFGTGLTAADAAVAALGEEVVQLPGADGTTYLDLAEPPPAQSRALGVRLLPEFDAVLVGYDPQHRTRFLSASDLASVWAKVNSQIPPVVLQDDHLVATWRTVTAGSRTAVEVTMLPGHAAPPEDLLGVAATATGTVLDLDVSDVRVLR